MKHQKYLLVILVLCCAVFFIYKISTNKESTNNFEHKVFEKTKPPNTVKITKPVTPTNNFENWNDEPYSEERALKQLEELALGPLQYNCPNIVRFGHSGDGGWDVCVENIQPGKCLVFSVGISDDTSFDVDIHNKLGCEVYGWDHTVKTDDTKVKNFYFYKIGLGGYKQRQPKLLTLSEMKHITGTSDRTIDIFKIDCEGCEWEFLPLESPSILNKINQMCIELHFTPVLKFNLESFSRFYEHWILKSGFKLYHRRHNQVHVHLKGERFLRDTDPIVAKYFRERNLQNDMIIFMELCFIRK